jgi:hypothetical protein
MNENPFAQKSPAPDPNWGRRRSSRLDYTTPVVVIGRDLQGQTFREQTVTTTVNLHGARLVTRRQIPVGMQVTLEVPATGSAVKAVCVRVETQPGSGASYIAVQLVRPENIWGVENPPADWVLVATEMIGDPLFALPLNRRSSASGSALPPSTETNPLPPTIPELSADLESKVGELTATVLKTLEARASALTEKALLEFQRRLEYALEIAEKRLGDRSDQAFADLDAALETFRSDLGDELDARRQEAVASAESALRERIAAALSSSAVATADSPADAARTPPKSEKP